MIVQLLLVSHCRINKLGRTLNRIVIEAAAWNTELSSFPLSVCSLSCLHLGAFLCYQHTVMPYCLIRYFAVWCGRHGSFHLSLSAEAVSKDVVPLLMRLRGVFELIFSHMFTEVKWDNETTVINNKRLFYMCDTFSRWAELYLLLLTSFALLVL